VIYIEVRIEDGVVTSLNASGHGGAAAKGNNVVCAAASTLLRTLARLFEESEGVELEGDAPQSGQLWFSVGEYNPAERQRLQGMSDYFLFGIKTLEREYPEEISVNIITNR
jgi:uncharacterized protein YsxB (DUF464 family)